MTRPYAEVIGDPIAHSKSPLIHNFWLGKLDIDAEYRARHVRPDELPDYFTRRRRDPAWRGCNVTLPHKETAFALMASRDAKAAALGATNCILPASGDFVATNTDVDGVAAAIEPVALAAVKVCIIGSGGAARAAFHRLTGQTIESLIVLARNPEKAVGIVSGFALPAGALAIDEAAQALEDADLLINATQLGMTGQPPLPSAIVEALPRMKARALVFDMVYAPLETDLLKAAAVANLRTADGLQMLVGQAATAFERFFGQPAPRKHDAELRALLTA